LCDAFTGGIFQAWNLVQIIVIKLNEERLEGIFEVGEVLNPSRFHSDRTMHPDFYTKRMPV
jgi:hypothetical protein